MFDCRTDSNQKTGFSIRVDYVDSDCPIKNYCLFFCTCLVLFWNDFFLQIIMFHHCILMHFSVFGSIIKAHSHDAKQSCNISYIRPTFSTKQNNHTPKRMLCNQKLLFKIQNNFQHMILFAWKQKVFNTSLCITWHLWSTPGRGCQRFLKHLIRPYLRFLH